jgi:hypothetical protein
LQSEICLSLHSLLTQFIMPPIHLLLSIQLLSLPHLWEQDFWLHAHFRTGLLSICCSSKYNE